MPVILKLLKKLDAYIICLQELDIQCERSKNSNNFEEIGKELQMNGVFVCEFEELHSPIRGALTQGGGWHGNAIFSHFPIQSSWQLEHTHALDWEKQGESFKEPRKGNRHAIGADIRVGEYLVRCYSLHLEIFCGIARRKPQYLEVQKDCLQKEPPSDIQLIFGDFNTMAHGFARLIPRYCNDRYRFSSLGLSEARWWELNVFKSGTAHFQHFLDPFHKTRDWTLWHVKGMIFKGKLDWTLVRGTKILNWSMHNLDFAASDHRLLYLEIESIPTNPILAHHQNMMLAFLCNYRFFGWFSNVFLVIGMLLLFFCST